MIVVDLITTLTIFLFSSYVIINLYTDIRYRRTSNILHFISLIIALTYFDFTKGSSYKVLVLMSIALAFGLLLEKMKTSSPGDTKMFIVMSVWISSLSSGNPLKTTLMFCITTYVIHLFIAWISWVRKKGIWTVLKEQRTQLMILITPGAPLSKEIIFENWPGAINMCIGAILTLALGTVML